MSDQPIVIRELDRGDRTWLEEQLRSSWGLRTIVTRGRAHDAARAPSLEVGDYGIPLHDELEFELALGSMA